MAEDYAFQYMDYLAGKECQNFLKRSKGPLSPYMKLYTTVSLGGFRWSLVPFLFISIHLNEDTLEGQDNVKWVSGSMAASFNGES